MKQGSTEEPLVILPLSCRGSRRRRLATRSPAFTKDMSPQHGRENQSTKKRRVGDMYFQMLRRFSGRSTASLRHGGTLLLCRQPMATAVDRISGRRCKSQVRAVLCYQRFIMTSNLCQVHYVACPLQDTGSFSQPRWNVQVL